MIQVTHNARALGRQVQSYVSPRADAGTEICVDLNGASNGTILMDLPLADAKVIHRLLGLAIRDAEEAA